MKCAFITYTYTIITMVPYRHNQSVSATKVDDTTRTYLNDMHPHLWALCTQNAQHTDTTIACLVANPLVLERSNQLVAYAPQKHTIYGGKQTSPPM
jgi:hypothetical protein